MSRRNRILIGIITLFCLSVGAMLYQVSSDLEIRYREAAEETMVDTAYLLANAIETDIQPNQSTINSVRLAQIFANIQTQRFAAQIYAVSKSQVDLRAYVTNNEGVVIYDSTGQNVGKDFSRWHDIGRTLAGQYGARTTPDVGNDMQTAVMYVAAPVRSAGKIVGVVSVGKPVAAQEALISAAQHKLTTVALITLAALLVLLMFVLVWLARPFGLTADIWRVIQQERHPARIWQGIKTLLQSAFSDMRDALAGRSYTEAYIQSLTHEIKSPLTAIRCAAELLNEPMSEQQRQRFTRNINEQVGRMQEMVDQLLALASVEKMRTLSHIQEVSLDCLLQELMTAFKPTATLRAVQIICVEASNISMKGDAFLLQRALSNLLANALDFSPANSQIIIQTAVKANKVTISVRDHGAGIPDYALNQVFDKFYSLPRPNSDHKSSGLGLAFVREIAQLHGGKATLENHPEGGAIATLVLPAST